MDFRAQPLRSDLRNLHLHRAAVEKLRRDPALRGPCLALVERWLAAPELQHARPYLERWRELLTGAPDDELSRVVLDPDAGQALRKCSPLGPVFTPRERWAVLAEVSSR
jgi:hypothetical protein